MAKGRKTGGKDFAKGHSPMGGRPPLPEDLKGVKELKPEYFKRLISLFWSKSIEELTAMAENPAMNALHRNLARVILKIDEFADERRFEFLLRRSIGPVTEQVNVKMPAPTVIKRLNGEQIVLGAEIEDDDDPTN